MRDIKKELQEEKRELDLKIGKLRSFIGSDTYLELSDNYLLIEQLCSMEQYSNTLGLRLRNMVDSSRCRNLHLQARAL